MSIIASGPPNVAPLFAGEEAAVVTGEKRNAGAKVVMLPAAKKAVEEKLRQSVLDACEQFQIALGRGDKDYLRALHMQVKEAQAGAAAVKASILFKKYRSKFRTGSEIDPEKIRPVLKLVVDDEWSDLFVVVRSLWSMPYNKGYGRRLRFVVYDEHHDGVIGIIGLQSPPADLQVRDALFNYPEDGKLDLVNCTMDAFAVGAVPPYSYLLGGKLCAGLISTDTIRQAYWRQYAGKKTEMRKLGVQQPLVAVTTTSAFGRSSQYNRLKFGDRLLAEPIGYTQGFGTLHLEGLYEQMCDYLRMENRFTKGGFGNGPKVRWQNITRALIAVGLPRTLLRHGLQREVFLYRFVDDLEGGMMGQGFGQPIALGERDFGAYWRARWATPRAQRFPWWNQGNERDLLERTLAIAVREKLPE